CNLSSSSSVAASPVDPQATMKSIPDSICQLTSDQSAGSSTDPSALNGVTIAVPQPVVSMTGQVYNGVVQRVRTGFRKLAESLTRNFCAPCVENKKQPPGLIAKACFENQSSSKGTALVGPK